MAGPCEREETEKQSLTTLVEKGATANVQEKPSLCASGSASEKWGELGLPLSVLQVGIPVSGSEAVRPLERGSCRCALTPWSGQERSAPGRWRASGEGLCGP